MKRALILLFVVVPLCLLNDGRLRAGEGQVQPTPVRIDLDQAIELALAQSRSQSGYSVGREVGGKFRWQEME